MNVSPDCPEKSKLVDYIMGKLPVIEHETCEVHIADCSACEDTIRGLDATDTLDELARHALTDPSESNELSLVNRLVENVRGIQHTQSTTQSEFDRLTLERSAEVARFLSLADDSGDIGQIAHYRLTDLLGAGSTGVVYRAIDEQLERAVALKVLRPSLGETARARFIAEAKSAAAVDHANVITIYQVGEEGQLAYMAMQLLPGETLEARLKRDVFLQEDSVRSIAGQIADGLAAAHSKDLIHRDIKPANIWLDENDQVKILDFGLARIVDDDPGFTSTGMIAGTPCYMSPEQSKGAMLDGRSDLFSLGCILYRAATGRQPFGAANILSTLQAIQTSTPKPPANTSANVTQEFSDLTMSLLEKLPVNRPASASQVAEALRSERTKWPFAIPEYKSVDSDAETIALPKKAAAGTSSGMSWIGQLATLIAVGMLGVGGYLFGGDIIRIATGHGLLTIETDDPDVKIELLEAGKLVRIIDTKTEKQIDIKEGKYKLQVAGEDNSVEISPVDLTMKRGGKAIAHVTHSSDSPSSQRSSGPSVGIANNLDVAWTESDSPAAISITEKVNQEQIAKVRASLQKKLSTVTESIPVLELQTNAQWLDAQLELAEFEVDAGMRKLERQDSYSPSEIATTHAKLLWHDDLLKRRLKLGFDGTTEAALALKTRAELAQRQLRGFESMHRLNINVAKYNGQTLGQFLKIARTERNDTKLGEAYNGVAHLVDQFDSRQEFIEFVKEALELNVPRFLRQNRTVPSSTENGVLALLLELKGNELAEISTGFITSSDVDNQSIPKILVTGSRFVDLVANSFHNQDDLYEQLLEANTTSAKTFLAFLTRHTIARGDQTASKSIMNRLNEMFQAEAENNSNDMRSRRVFTETLRAVERKTQRNLSAAGMGMGRGGADGGGGDSHSLGAGGSGLEEHQIPKPYFKTYQVKKHTDEILGILGTLISRDESIKLDQDQKTKKLYVMGTDRHHKLVAGVLNALSSDSLNLIRVDNEETLLGVYKTKSNPSQVLSMLEEIVSSADFHACPREDSIILLGKKEEHDILKKLLKTLEKPEQPQSSFKGKTLQQWLEFMATSDSFKQPLDDKNIEDVKNVLTAFEQLAGPKQMDNVIRASFKHIIRNWNLFADVKLAQKEREKLADQIEKCKPLLKEAGSSGEIERNGKTISIEEIRGVMNSKIEVLRNLDRETSAFGMSIGENLLSVFLSQTDRDDLLIRFLNEIDDCNSNSRMFLVRFAEKLAAEIPEELESFEEKIVTKLLAMGLDVQDRDKRHWAQECLLRMEKIPGLGRNRKGRRATIIAGAFSDKSKPLAQGGFDDYLARQVHDVDGLMVRIASVAIDKSNPPNLRMEAFDWLKRQNSKHLESVAELLLTILDQDFHESLVGVRIGNGQISEQSAHISLLNLLSQANPFPEAAKPKVKKYRDQLGGLQLSEIQNEYMEKLLQVAIIAAERE